MIEYHDNVFIFAELKLRGADVPRGQQMAVVRLVDRLRESGAKAWFFVADHTVDDPGHDVPADLCVVRNIYTEGEWRTPDRATTLLEACDAAMGYKRPSLVAPAAADDRGPVQAPREDQIRW